MSFPRSTDQPLPPEPIVRRPAFLASVPQRGEAKDASFPRGARARQEAMAEPAIEKELLAEPNPAPVEEMTGEDQKPFPELPVPIPVKGMEAPLPIVRAAPAEDIEARTAPQRSPEAEAELLGRLGAAIDVLRLQSERLAEQARADALEIGFQVARRILEIELSTSPESLFSLVRSAVRRAGESRVMKVRLHPADKAVIESQGGAQRIDPLAISTLELVGDPLLRRGDCVVEADFGTVDGRLESRLDELRRVVASAFHEEPL